MICSARISLVLTSVSWQVFLQLMGVIKLVKTEKRKESCDDPFSHNFHRLLEFNYCTYMYHAYSLLVHLFVLKDKITSVL